MSRTSTKPKRNIWTDPSPYGTYEGEAGSPDSWRSFFKEAWSKATAQKLIGDDHETPYKILGIDVGASLAEIKKAFHTLIIKHHPDRGGDNETARKIIAAYTVLTEN
jgi:DnaJ-class molecular chaperone